MDVARGAAMGAFLGAGGAWLARFFAPQQPAGEVGVETEHLSGVDPLHRAVVSCRDLSLADERAKALYAELVQLADAVAGHVSGGRRLPEFSFNRACSQMQAKAKELCVQAGRSRAFAVRSRQVAEEDLASLTRFCEDALHNMTLSPPP